MIKGLCEIELKDESGNVVKKTYDENMEKSGISRYLDTDYNLIVKLLNKEDMKNHYNRLTPLIQKLIGGVYLYNKEQTELIDNVIPDPFSIVGSGSLCKSQIADERCGIWNIDESSILYNDKGEINGFKFVWDFLTSKGNGTIRSVSLTTDIGARSMFTNYLMGHFYYYNSGSGSTYYLGTTAPFNLINPVVEKLNGGQSDYVITNSSSNPLHFEFLKYGICGSYKNNLIVLDSYNTSSKVITFAKYKIRDAIKLNDSLIKTGSISAFEDKPGTEQISKFYIDISDWNITPDAMKCFAQSNVINGFLYVVHAYNKDIKLKKINLDTYEVIESVNRTFEQGYLNMPYYQQHYQFGIIGNYYIVHRKDVSKLIDKISILNKTDLTIAKEIDIGSCNNPSMASLGITYTVNYGYVDKMVVLLFQHYDSTRQNTIIKYTIFIDDNLNIKIGNENTLYYDSSKINIPIQCDTLKYPYLLTKHYYCSSQKLYQTGHTLLVSANTNLTIDNLQTPVTKTPSQTMKVIYTIKDVEETT